MLSFGKSHSSRRSSRRSHRRGRRSHGRRSHRRGRRSHGVKRKGRGYTQLRKITSILKRNPYKLVGAGIGIGLLGLAYNKSRS
jgi:hypothetical protein